MGTRIPSLITQALVIFFNVKDERKKKSKSVAFGGDVLDVIAVVLKTR